MDLSFNIHPLTGVSRKVLLSPILRSKFVRGVSASMKSSVIVLCRPEFTVGTVITELGNQSAVGIVGFQDDVG